jgi:hypothetical protein
MCDGIHCLFLNTFSSSWYLQQIQVLLLLFRIFLFWSEGRKLSYFAACYIWIARELAVLLIELNNMPNFFIVFASQKLLLCEVFILDCCSPHRLLIDIHLCIWLQDLSSFVTKSMKEIEHVMNVGNQNRSVG